MKASLVAVAFALPAALAGSKRPTITRQRDPFEIKNLSVEDVAPEKVLPKACRYEDKAEYHPVCLDVYEYCKKAFMPGNFDEWKGVLFLRCVREELQAEGFKAEERPAEGDNKDKAKTVGGSIRNMAKTVAKFAGGIF